MKWKVLIISLLWLAPAQATGLPPRTGHLAKGNRFAQFANVQYCGKVVSITVAHLTDSIAYILPEVTPLALNEASDIAIYPMLGVADIAPLADYQTAFRSAYYHTYTYIYWLQTYVLVKYSYGGVYQPDGTIIIQGPAWFGISGSGVFNEAGEFVGSNSAIILAPGPGGMPLVTGLATITNYYRIKELLDIQVCSK